MHLGIIKEHGDAFIYKIWTLQNGDYNKGCELVRDVVKNRECKDIIPRAEYLDNDLLLTRHPQERKQKRPQQPSTVTAVIAKQLTVSFSSP